MSDINDQTPGDRSHPDTTPTPGGTAPLAGHTVSRIGYGAMGLERLHDDPRAAVAVVRRAIEHGIDHIDTAQFYGNGFVNDILRQAVRPEDGVTIASKVGATPDPDGPLPMRSAQKPAELRADVEDNLRTLGLESIPVVNLRRMDIGPGITATGDQAVDLDDQLAEMIKLRDEGKIGAIGLSSVSTAVVQRALPAGIVCVQNAYNALSRESESTLDLCRAEGMAWVPFFPLGSGFDGFAKVTDDPVVVDAAERLGVRTSQVALAWLLGHAPNTLLIPGTASPEHLDENIAAGDLELGPEITAAIDEIGAASLARGEQPPAWPGAAH